MAKDYGKPFFYLAPPEPPDGLFEKIINRIKKEQRLSTIKRRLVIFSAGMVFCAASFVPLFKLVEADLFESGFLQFFSLVFTDFEVVTVYWQSFSMSLLESIPAMSLAMLFAAAFVFLKLFKSWANNLKSLFASKQLISA